MGEHTLVDSIPVNFGPAQQAYLYPGYSAQVVFNKTGLYEYGDKDSPRLHGFVHVVAMQDSGVRVVIPEGSDIGNGPNYQPQLVRVVIGINSTVTWTNNSNETNGVWADNSSDDVAFYTSTHSRVNLNGTGCGVTSRQDYNSNVMPPGCSFRYTFTQPGIIQYHGNAFLSGTVVVLPPASTEPYPEYSFYEGTGSIPANQVFRGNYAGINETNGVVTVGNRSFYMTTVNASSGLAQGEFVKFHNVTFSFPQGTAYTLGGAYAVMRMDFEDGSREVIGKSVEFENGGGLYGGIAIVPLGPSSGWDRTLSTYLTSHLKPQAGVTVTLDQQVKLLISTS